jgi:hypothetical protein
MNEAAVSTREQGPEMPELLAPLAVSLMIFFCTFGAAVSGMILRKKLPVDHLSEDSKDVMKLVMGLIATMAALVLGLLIASANSSYETQSGELQQVSATIVELDGILAQYGPEANEPRHRLRAVSAAADKIWSKDGIRLGQLAPAAIHAEAASFYDSIANLSPTARMFSARIGYATRKKEALAFESSLPARAFAHAECGDGSSLTQEAAGPDRRCANRKGYAKKTVLTDAARIAIAVPRDRAEASTRNGSPNIGDGFPVAPRRSSRRAGQPRGHFRPFDKLMRRPGHGRQGNIRSASWLTPPRRGRCRFLHSVM